MKKHHCLICSLLLGLGLLPFRVFAQQEGQPAVVKTRIDVPAPLGGLIPQLSPVNDGEPGTVLTGGLGLNARYEDNTVALDGGRTGQYQYSVLPSIGLRGLGHETQWTLNYTGGMTFAQSGAPNDLVTHRGTADLRHEFSQRLSTELRQDYLVTNSPFARLETIATLPALSGPGTLSSFFVPSTATQTVSVSMASLGYQLGPHAAMGLSGNLSMQRFRDVITASGSSGSLIDTRSIAGRGFYVSKLSPRQTVGAEYQLQDLSFLGGTARAMDHTVFLFDEISMRSDMKLSLFAGPERSHIHNVLILNSDLSTSVEPGLNDQWSWAGGAMYTWQGKRTGLRAALRRGVGDGGGFLGAIRLTNALIDVPMRLNARWNISSGVSYSDGRTLGSTARTNGDRLTYIEGHSVIEHWLTHDIKLHGQYAHTDVINGGTFSLSIPGHHNQIEIGLDYRFHRTLSQ